MIKNRNGEIDLFRFIFCIIILVGHTVHTFGLNKIMPRSAIGTEFFFLVTGCLMAKKASTQKRELTNEEIAHDTWQYIIRKAKLFFPYYLIALILKVFCVLIIHNWTLTTLIEELLQTLPLLSLSFVGLGVRGSLCLWGSWFLSAMIIASLVLYPMLLKNYHVSTKIIFPLMGILLMQYNYKSYSIITVLMQNKTFVTGGLIRALSEIAIGASIYELSLWLKKVVSDRSAFLLTGIKYLSYLVAILYAVRFHGSMTDIDYFLWLTIAVTLSFSDVGYKVKESALTRYLGKITLPIYIFHMLVVYSACSIMGKNIDSEILILVMVVSVLFSLIVMYATDFLLKIKKQQKL